LTQISRRTYLGIALNHQSDITVMKRLATSLLGTLVALSLFMAGCKGRHVSTSELEHNFKGGEPATLEIESNAVAAIKSGKYPEALTYLQKLAHRAMLSPDQQQAIRDTTDAVQKRLDDQAKKAAADAQKSAPH